MVSSALPCAAIAVRAEEVTDLREALLRYGLRLPTDVLMSNPAHLLLRPVIGLRFTCT